MITPQLISYIRGQLASGTPKEVITKALTSSGWSMSDITEGFRMITTNTPTNIPSSAPAQSTTIVDTAVEASSHTGGKILLSFGLIAISTFYSFFAHVKAAQQATVLASVNAPTTQQQLIATATVPPSSQPVEPTPAQIVAALPPPPKKTTTVTPPPKKTTPVATAPKPTPAPTPTPTPTPTPVPPPAPVVPPKPKGQYNDGTYTGSQGDAYYGIIQVQAIISGGKLVDVKFLQYPNDRRTSIEINSQAMPYLKQEAITVQSAHVDIVSGATDSSQAFQQSLGDALAQAKV